MAHVTPCVGVWIEILLRLPVSHLPLSLPAWECGLKSHFLLWYLSLKQSLPAWECGLKWQNLSALHRGFAVTPCVGVWIEIHMNLMPMLVPCLSLPAWECGLKYTIASFLLQYIMSLPAWECGLKFPYAVSTTPDKSSLPAWECGLKWLR